MRKDADPEFCVLGMPGPCEHEEAADQRIRFGAYGASALRRQLHDVAGSEAER